MINILRQCDQCTDELQMKVPRTGGTARTYMQNTLSHRLIEHCPNSKYMHMCAPTHTNWLTALAQANVHITLSLTKHTLYVYTQYTSTCSLHMMYTKLITCSYRALGETHATTMRQDHTRVYRAATYRHVPITACLLTPYTRVHMHMYTCTWTCSFLHTL